EPDQPPRARTPGRPGRRTAARPFVRPQLTERLELNGGRPGDERVGKNPMSTATCPPPGNGPVTNATGRPRARSRPGRSFHGDSGSRTRTAVNTSRCRDRRRRAGRAGDIGGRGAGDEGDCLAHLAWLCRAMVERYGARRLSSRVLCRSEGECR